MTLPAQDRGIFCVGGQRVISHRQRYDWSARKTYCNPWRVFAVTPGPSDVLYSVKLSDDPYAIRNVCLLGGGRLIVEVITYAGDDERESHLMVFDAISARTTTEVKCGPSLVETSLSRSNNGKYFVRVVPEKTNNSIGRVRIEVRDSRLLRVIHSLRVSSELTETGYELLAVSDDARFIAIGGDKVVVADLQNGASHTLWITVDGVRWKRFGKRQEEVYQTVCTWGVGGVYEWRPFRKIAFRPVALDFVAGNELVVVTGDGLVRHWDATT